MLRNFACVFMIQVAFRYLTNDDILTNNEIFYHKTQVKLLRNFSCVFMIQVAFRYLTNNKKNNKKRVQALFFYYSFYYSNISVTIPEPTVLPPSRIANLSPFSIAIGVINSIVILVLSPGITISVPASSSINPVTSVVLK